MAWKVEVASNAAATTWTDITAYVDNQTAKVGGQGAKLAVGTGSGIDVDDDAGTRYVPGRRVLRVTEDATTPDAVVFRGRVSTKSLGRWRKHQGDAKKIAVQLDDYNQDVWGIIVDGQHRPREFDYERIEWLIAKYLSGTSSTSGRARDSTDIDPSLVSHASPRWLPAEDYFDATPGQILADIIAVTGKECFITVDGEMYYALGTDTSYAADISITDVTPDSIDSFAPEWEGDAADEDPAELLSGAKARYGTSEHTNVSERRPAVEASNDKWEELTRFTTKDAQKAADKLTTMLDKRGAEEKRRKCLIRLPASQIDRIKWGQTISYRAAASGDLTPVTLRIARMFLDLPPTPITPYVIHLELEFPKKVSAGGSEPPGTIPPGPFVPGPTSSGIAAQADLHVVDGAPANDVTWLYPAGHPAGRMISGLQYKLVYDILTNRYVPGGWGYTRASGAGVSVLSGGPGSPVTVGSMTDPMGPGLDLTSGTMNLSVDDDSTDPGNHYESHWYTYGGSDIDVDLYLGGQPASGFYGHEQTARVTLYVRNADGSPVIDPGAPTPTAGQAVQGEPSHGDWDGVTKTGQTDFPYVAGSLKHFQINGVDAQKYVHEVNPATGTYLLDYAPPPGATVTYDYVAAGGTPSSGGGSTDTGSGTDPDPVFTFPGGTPPLQTAGDFQDAIDATTTGEVLDLTYGTYPEDIVIDRAMTIRGNGSLIDGGGSRLMWATILANDVHIQDLLMQDAAPDTASAQKAQEGSIRCVGYHRLTLFNVHTLAGRDCNITLQGSSGSTINGCSFKDAPRAGMTAGGVPNLVVRDSKFNDNHTNATYDSFWEGGGYKIGGGGSTNLLFERVEASGNLNANGHWIDEHPSNVTMRDCWSDHNGYAAFFLEISRGITVIRPRTWENGWDSPIKDSFGWSAGLMCSSASAITLVDYISAWDASGKSVVNQGDRSNREASTQMKASGGLIAGDTGRVISGWFEDGSGNQTLFTDPTNGETGLRYYSVGSPEFDWNGSVSAATFAGTRGGQGMTSISSGAMIALLDAADVGGVAGVGIPNAPESH